MRFALFSLTACFLVACSSDNSKDDPNLGGANCGPDGSVATDSTPAGDDGLNVDAAPMDATMANCEPPDLLVLLDRTMTMHFRPDGSETPMAENTTAGRQKTKFAIAIDALKSVFATYDTQIRFGLELWPRERDNCILVKTRIDQAYGTPAGPPNPSCEAGEIKSAPGLGNAAGMGALLDVETTPLCLTTPLAAALKTAGDYLNGIKAPKRAQYLAVVTDGADYDTTCPSPMYPDAIKTISDLADAGLKTFVIGFGGDLSTSGTDPAKMNKLACAAQTAKDFATSCKKGTTGIYEPVDPSGATHLYLEADDKTKLVTALGGVAASLGCKTCLK
jgi:hypothetical protein